MAMTTSVRHHSSVDLSHACTVEASLVSTEHATEVYLRLAPVASATSRNACHIQSRVLYDALDEVLHGLSARAEHVLVEKAYFRNLVSNHEEFNRVRGEFYQKRGLVGDNLPGITCLGLPSCRAGVDVELQIYAIIPTSPHSVTVTACPSPQAGMSVKLLEIGSARHLLISNATGQLLNGEPGGFRRQCDQMFRVVGDVLSEHGAAFGQTLRAWLCLADIRADYAELNGSRDSFFSERSVERLPASTAVGGSLQPASARCTLDVYALLNPEIARIEVMKAPCLNEASAYGSAFSRGVKLSLSESTYLFVSATPGIDGHGEVVGPGNTRVQMERMLLNVQELLSAHGAGWSDVSHAVTYLRSADDLEAFDELCAEHGFADAPHTVVQAELCRAELVCEMEAVAVIPSA